MDQNEKLNKLRQQIHLIEHNLIALDDLELVALNIATNVRVLVHDTISSTSLLKLMSVKDSIDYYDTSVAKGSISFWKGNFSISGPAMKPFQCSKKKISSPYWQMPQNGWHHE